MLVGIVDSNLQISYQNIIVQHIKSLQEFLKGSVYFLQNYKLVNMKFSIFHPTFLFQSTWLTEGLRHVAVMDVHLWSCIIMKIVVIILYTVSCYRLDSTRLDSLGRTFSLSHLSGNNGSALVEVLAGRSSWTADETYKASARSDSMVQ